MWMSFEEMGSWEFSDMEESVNSNQLWCVGKALGMADLSMCTMYDRDWAEIEQKRRLITNRNFSATLIFLCRVAMS